MFASFLPPLCKRGSDPSARSAGTIPQSPIGDISHSAALRYICAVARFHKLRFVSLRSGGRSRASRAYHRASPSPLYTRGPRREVSCDRNRELKEYNDAQRPCFGIGGSRQADGGIVAKPVMRFVGRTVQGFLSTNVREMATHPKAFPLMGKVTDEVGREIA